MASVNEKFIVNLKGKDFVTYEGLLDLAHQNGLKTIEVTILQLPNESNNFTCICMATARTEEKSFTDIGDASPKSVNSMIIPHLIRMASTRAKARCLRDLNNIGMTAIEEVMEDVVIEGGDRSKGNGKTKGNGKKDNQERISQEEANEIKELIRIKNQDIALILKYNNIPTIEALTKVQAENVRKFLAKK